MKAGSPIVIEEVPYGSALYDEVTELRRVLLRAPLGLDFTAEELAREKDDVHIAAVEDRRVVGTLLLRRVDTRTSRLMRMAVTHDMQGRGVGRALIARAEDLLRERRTELLMMHARVTAIGFYERCGYRAVGESFLEQGIPHIRMEKRL